MVEKQALVLTSEPSLRIVRSLPHAQHSIKSAKVQAHGTQRGTTSRCLFGAQILELPIDPSPFWALPFRYICEQLTVLFDSIISKPSFIMN